jgi:hypothetical protein
MMFEPSTDDTCNAPASDVAKTPKGHWVVEAGIRKFIAGRSAEEAAAEAEAALARPVSDAVFHIDESVSLDEVNAMELNPGATVLFKRGAVWRGQLQPRSGKPGHPVTYGAYGAGAKPAIQPSYDRSRPEDWRRESDGTWSAGTDASADIGNVILDHGDSGCLFKRNRRDDLARDRDFWCDPVAFRVHVKSASNPALRWKSIELAAKINGVNQAHMHDVVYDGLAIRYSAAHGFGGDQAKRIVIRNCDISWIGGGYLYFNNKGDGVRYGNGIEFWGTAEDILVESNHVWECWDAGLTNQSSLDDTAQRNIVWRNNDVWNCEYSYEYWQQGDGAVTENVRVEDNVFRDAGKGWGHAQRWNPNAAHLMFYDTTADTRGFRVARNVFSQSEDCLFRFFNDWRKDLEMAENRWISGGEPICRYHGRPKAGLQHRYPDRLDVINDDNLAEIESQGSGARVFDKDDLVDFLEFIGETTPNTGGEA